MSSFSSFVLTLSLSWLSMICFVHALHAEPKPNFFNVMDFGAVADGETDNSEVFMKTWDKACLHSKGKSRVLIPKGTYKLRSVLFKGPCNGPISFLIKGVLKAPTHPSEFNTDHWILFQYVDRLVVKGGGYLDGQGWSAWKYNDCSTNSNCKPLPTTMRFDIVHNSSVHHLKSIDSKNTHFNLFGCNNFNMSHIRIKSPETSPNTDGIKIGGSNNTKISHSIIETGDDCIAMLSGSHNISISDVTCGPGHGISIGSLGRSDNKDNSVRGITIANCTFKGTQNGVRIKTWAPSDVGMVSDLSFGNIFMENVNNPIIIDQQYCPSPNCDDNANSSVQIKNVTFSNIWGSSSSEVAITLNCSKTKPCQDIELANINLYYNGTGGRARSSCMNAMGSAYGKQNPRGCL